MKNFLFPALILGIILFADYVLACPSCAGSMDNPNDTKLVYILMVFIGLIYIPFFILYRTVYKNRKLNQQHSANE